jgi:hypothetical protein
LAQWLCDALLKSIVARQIRCEDLDHLASTHEFCEYFLATALGEADPLEKLISFSFAGPAFEEEQVVADLARLGVSDRSRIDDGLQFLCLNALLARDGRQYRFVLKQFPRIVRETGSDSQVKALLEQVNA